MNCYAPGCSTPTRRTGLCSKHYQQKRRHGSEKGFVFDRHIIQQPCGFEGCGLKARAGKTGLCPGHYGQKIKTGRLSHINRGAVCPVRECTSPGGARKRLCKAHAAYTRRYGFSEEQVVILFDRGYECQNPGCRSQTSLHLDHDHSCCPQAKMCWNCVRGWLCGTCNLSLGLLGEDPERIRGLLTYIGATR